MLGIVSTCTNAQAGGLDITNRALKAACLLCMSMAQQKPLCLLLILLCRVGYWGCMQAMHIHVTHRDVEGS